VDLTVPDTPVAAAAAALAAEACPPFLLNHSHRTYLFGRMLVPDADLDEEAAFVASMVHDLGLTEAHRGDAGFDQVGADLACRFLEARGWHRDRIALVEQAIIRHTNLVANDVPEHRLVQAGAALDVAGIPPDALRSDTAEAVLAHHPRLDFRAAMPRIFLDEIARQPDGVFADLEQAVNLSEVMASHPLDGP
jgi:hypothetical protein